MGRIDLRLIPEPLTASSLHIQNIGIVVDCDVQHYINNEVVTWIKDGLDNDRVSLFSGIIIEKGLTDQLSDGHQWSTGSAVLTQKGGSVRMAATGNSHVYESTPYHLYLNHSVIYTTTNKIFNRF